MIKSSTIKLLRFPFSLFLSPVYFFALSQSPKINVATALLIFGIFHLLVYPASNGYNSYIDKDTESIGGLKNPPQPDKQLLYVVLIMDIAAILLSLILGFFPGLLVLIYIVFSRAYSSRKIRIKKYPFASFFCIFICQGALVYAIVSMTQNISLSFSELNWLPCLISSCLIGAAYPLTQIYQHNEDRKNGDITLSLKLGYRGTFLFSGSLFSLSGALFFIYFFKTSELWKFYALLAFLLPVFIYFFTWFTKVYKDISAANFENTMRMNYIGTLCTGGYFIFLLLFS
jgi:1,4-dihydroxy-2-naphthoate polyprenyltransferase